MVTVRFVDQQLDIICRYTFLAFLIGINRLQKTGPLFLQLILLIISTAIREHGDGRTARLYRCGKQDAGIVVGRLVIGQSILERILYGFFSVGFHLGPLKCSLRKALAGSKRCGRPIRAELGRCIPIPSSRHTGVDVLFQHGAGEGIEDVPSGNLYRQRLTQSTVAHSYGVGVILSVSSCLIRRTGIALRKLGPVYSTIFLVISLLHGDIVGA